MKISIKLRKFRPTGITGLWGIHLTGVSSPTGPGDVPDARFVVKVRCPLALEGGAGGSIAQSARSSALDCAIDPVATGPAGRQDGDKPHSGQLTRWPGGRRQLVRLNG